MMKKVLKRNGFLLTILIWAMVAGGCAHLQPPGPLERSEADEKPSESGFWSVMDFLLSPFRSR
jgi:hypothetical protein